MEHTNWQFRWYFYSLSPPLSFSLSLSQTGHGWKPQRLVLYYSLPLPPMAMASLPLICWTLSSLSHADPNPWWASLLSLWPQTLLLYLYFLSLWSSIWRGNKMKIRFMLLKVFDVKIVLCWGGTIFTISLSIALIGIWSTIYYKDHLEFFVFYLSVLILMDIKHTFAGYIFRTHFRFFSSFLFFFSSFN